MSQRTRLVLTSSQQDRRCQNQMIILSMSAEISSRLFTSMRFVITQKCRSRNLGWINPRR
ncbi:hypothetical protein FOCG_18429 [Fusarium oxysporum f. sp. radicis-lycopersici 26381]|nr:hypothetical protein FOCG_18429 [Fusarium oxysporum f. sp. radicis-lycopersici 26381]